MEASQFEELIRILLLDQKTLVLTFIYVNYVFLCGSGKFSWEQVLRYARLRKKYISLYASLLKSNINRPVVDDNSDIEELDRELDIELILQWRYFSSPCISFKM